jgi:lysophospholipase L1-like esterase
MPAMNGFAVSSRSTRRLIGCCVAAVLLVSALFASSASAAKTPLTPTNYVALGDSLAFGYTAQKNAEQKEAGEPPAAFEEGYANFLNKKLASFEKKTNGNALSLINMGCPGEVSDGLIGTNPAIGGGQSANGKSDSEPCAYNNVYPLHFEIGPASQLEAAIGVVTSPGTFGATKYVTLNIGSNDELAVVHACATPAYDEAHGYAGGLDECLVKEAGEEGVYYEKGLFHHIAANMGDVVGVLRAEGYTGVIGILGFYNPQAFILPGSDAIQKKLNEVLECTITSKAGTCTVEPKAGETVMLPGEEKFGPGVVYANPFPKFNPQKSKAEQKAVATLTEECNPAVQNFQTGAAPGCEGDIHPTVKGYKQLAKILFDALGAP